MADFIDWLLHDDRKDLYELLVALALQILFLLLAALVLWPLGRAALAASMLRGSAVFWFVVGLTTLAFGNVARALRLNIYDNAGAYVSLGLALGAILQVGWSAYAALLTQSMARGAPGLTVVILYVVGALSCLVAYYAVSSQFQGTIYRLVNLPLALLSFVWFSIWPASGDALYGWFFRLF